MKLLLLLALSAPLLAASPPDPEEAAYPAIERFIEVLEQVRQRHPDVDKLAYDRLVNHALEGMLASLDPHSSFIHPEMAALLKAHPDLDPFLPSLGITLGWRDDGTYLANVLPGSAAAELLPGSSLLEIDGRPTSQLEPAEILSALHSPPGTPVILRLKSPADPRPQEIALTHRLVATRALADSHLQADGTTGYLRLAEFATTASHEIETALDDLEDAGMKRLLLDLRGNPGGSLSTTVEILGLFLPPDTAVVTTRGRDDSATETLRTPTRQRRHRDYPIAVLIDRMSASASELTAGALQDLKRATVVGEISYGKGSVQNIIPMGGNTALRLTIATYHTPSGRTPHLAGITPDLPVETDATQRENIRLSFHPDSLTPEQTQRLAGWTDPVIQAATQHLLENP